MKEVKEVNSQAVETINISRELEDYVYVNILNGDEYDLNDDMVTRCAIFLKKLNQKDNEEFTRKLTNAFGDVLYGKYFRQIADEVIVRVTDKYIDKVNEALK